LVRTTSDSDSVSKRTMMIHVRQRRRAGMAEEAARQLAEYLVRNAPAGWTEALWASVAGRHSMGSSTPRYTVLGGPSRRQRLPSPFGVLGSMADEVRAVRGWESNHSL